MVLDTITYTDYDGNVRTETFRFHLTKAETIEMEVSIEGGLSKMVKTVMLANNNSAIFEVFKKLIMKSYGEKSPDGRRFVKSPELSKAFSETEGFNILIMKCLSDPDYAARFLKGIVNETPIKVSDVKVEKIDVDNVIKDTIAEIDK